MREILFRAKRVDNGKWIEGFILNEKHSKIGYYNNGYDFSIVEVIPETVGQFTLTDKNGKKIFEGDILKVHYEDYSSKKEFIGYVKYIVGAYGISYGQDRHFLEFAAMTSYIRGYEVIGNIYDNSELLKENENES